MFLERTQDSGLWEVDDGGTIEGAENTAVRAMRKQSEYDHGDYRKAPTW